MEVDFSIVAERPPRNKNGFSAAELRRATICVIAGFLMPISQADHVTVPTVNNGAPLPDLAGAKLGIEIGTKNTLDISAFGRFRMTGGTRVCESL